MKASNLFVKCLEQEGIEYIFGVPGEENADFVMSLQNSNVKILIYPCLLEEQQLLLIIPQLKLILNMLKLWKKFIKKKLNMLILN